MGKDKNASLTATTTTTSVLRRNAAKFRWKPNCLSHAPSGFSCKPPHVFPATL